MPWSDEISARCKALEAVATDPRAPKDQPLLVRLDGRAFHTYTRGLRRPFDERLSRCMIETTRTLVADSQARIGYTQSDEITLLFWAPLPTSNLPFDGRLQKLCSVLAGLASARFAVLAYESIPEKVAMVPHFDGRAWSVPSVDDAIEAIQWRMADARKNSVSMAAQSVYSHKQLLNKHTADQLQMLREKGIDWNDYPDFFRVGSFLRRETVQVQIDETERQRIPKKHRPAPGALVARSKTLEVKPPHPLTWEWLAGSLSVEDCRTHNQDDRNGANKS